MSDASRDRILARLRTAVPPYPITRPALPARASSQEFDLIAEFVARVEAGSARVARTTRAEMAACVARLLREEGVTTAAYAPATPLGAALESHWREPSVSHCELVPYVAPAEDFQERLFAADAGITACRAGVADSGSLVLCPTADEPRLLSLVPRVHVAVLDEDCIFATFADWVAEKRPEEDMPTNLILATGPSKTADIEGILVYGVHGPGKVIVVLVRG